MSTFILVVFSFLCGFGDKTRFLSGGDYTDVHREDPQQAMEVAVTRLAKKW